MNTDTMLRARLRELAARAAARGDIAYTRFLDPREQGIARELAREEGVTISFSGPEGLERRLAAFAGRQWLEDSERRYDWPALPLAILWDGRFASPAHRDLLGAILALGIGRESVGDILMGEGRAVCWVAEGVAGFVMDNLRSAGRATVKATLPEEDPEDRPEAQTRALKGSVHSLRLDAVVAEAFDLSREEAARAVTSGLVKLNWAEETKPDRRMDEGALLSLRGQGRAKLVRASERTRRSGRIVVEFERTM